MSRYWSIAVDAPLYEALTYSANEDLSAELERGHQVTVPLGKRKALGVVLGEISKPENTGFEIREILGLELETPKLPESYLKWIEWLAYYYMYPVGSIASLAYPPLKRSENKRKSKRPKVIPEIAKDSSKSLTNEQEKVFTDISAHNEFSVHLLFGVTGSGKTEVYLRLFSEVLNRKGRGLFLVPEISLTPQLVNRFAARFGEQIAVIHSQLTEREKTEQWWDFIAGKKSILIGARSALFCPAEKLDLIIVDEEHESSFKQDEKLKYHGRDAAVMLAKFHNCPVVLGSATPSLESWKNALDGKYFLHQMKKRVENRPLPDIEIIDLRLEKNPLKETDKSFDEQKPFWLTNRLQDAMAETLAVKKQIALFLNRRGVAQNVLCEACGYVEECPNCDITLTLHGKAHLVCHYCDYHSSLRASCPSCKEGELKAIGLGTEQLENDVRKFFPEARVARADRDEIQSRSDLEDLVQKMENNEIDILIGTQMIAKGLDFPNLQLVGLVLADVGFNLPDFRSTERSFQLITQVSGRAGRHVKDDEIPGKVLVQTYNTDHPSLIFAKATDYEGLAQQILAERRILNYPPFGRLISFRIQGNLLDKTQETSRLLAMRARSLKEKNPSLYEKVEVLGPVEAPIAKLRGKFRFHLLLKGLDSKTTLSFAYQLIGEQKWVPAGVRVSTDVDPLQLL